MGAAERRGPQGLPGGRTAGRTDLLGREQRLRRARRPARGRLARHGRHRGQDYSFRWQFTARHATSDFNYYITKDGWDSTKPLTRADLESQPFLTVPYNNQQPPMTLTHQGTLPAKTGKHLILAVWNVADTANAFYACSDVKF